MTGWEQWQMALQAVGAIAAAAAAIAAWATVRRATAGQRTSELVAIHELVGRFDTMTRGPESSLDMLRDAHALQMNLRAAVLVAPVALPACWRLARSDIPPVNHFKARPFTDLIDNANDEITAVLTMEGQRGPLRPIRRFALSHGKPWYRRRDRVFPRGKGRA